MWLDSVSRQLISEFWEGCGEDEPFPRDLVRSLALALPVALVSLPRLSLRDIEAWLIGKSIHYGFSSESRPVRGCLVAWGGHGVIFVDGADADDERRFTIAHETGHFLCNYWRPRRDAIARYGRCITEVLDGARLPTINERVFAALEGTRIAVHTDLMERDQGVENLNGEVWQIEAMADRIGLELLAPLYAVLRSADLSGAAYEERLQHITSLLRTEFGLPFQVSIVYGRKLLNMAGRGQSWLESLGLR
jgi:hypothetical protein